MLVCSSSGSVEGPNNLLRRLQVLSLANGLFDLAIVDAHVLIQVRLLSECLMAVWVCALEGSLTRMRAQVVKEVMPLAENHVAVSKIALHHANPPFCLIVVVVEDTEIASLRNELLLNIDIVKVNILAQVHLHIGIGHDLLEQPYVVVFLEGVLLLLA